MAGGFRYKFHLATSTSVEKKEVSIANKYKKEKTIPTTYVFHWGQQKPVSSSTNLSVMIVALTFLWRIFNRYPHESKTLVSPWKIIFLNFRMVLLSMHIQ